MNLYLTVRRGVYMQGIGGVFDTYDKAKVAMDKLKSEERDTYHKFEIITFKLNELAKLDDTC